LKGNTVGSRSKIKRFCRNNDEINLAYIAGFLDGDGSLMVQIKKRKDGRLKKRFMLTICFYQDSRNEKPLFWIKNILGIGFISRRNDRMTELRINGYAQVRRIIKKLIPYLKFKKEQARALYNSSDILVKTKINKLTKKDLVKLVIIFLLFKIRIMSLKEKRIEENY